ncbi:MAG: riboflavin biosynthesis protein RibF [Syntrophus sp. (in: bacteria)]|nr:riboflavin biosynthesis protein RibF [Syntrophus sp. (in: bacteria)]
MDVFNSLDEIPDDFRGAVVTIGNFDGVHRGHQHIFHKVLREARKEKSKAVVITFEPHPKMVLHPERQPFYLITSREEKIARIAETGIDGLLLIPFSLEFSHTTARQFIHAILWDRLRIKKILIGHDYTFGRNREGNEAMLAAAGEKLGFAVEVIGAFSVGDTVISSTLTRNLILAGRVKEAALYLGRPYNLGGEVIAGHRRGRALGFPTANLRPDKALIPARGIYAVRLLLAGKLHQGVLNIGFNPTFSDSTLSVEAYIFDFDEDIYGQTLEALFIDRIRDEMKFDGPALLVEQIRRDVESAREILISESRPR